MAVVEFIFDLKSPSWLTGNTNVPKLGEPIFLSNGKYALGDGVTQTQSLPLYGGATFTFTGTISQYVRGDGSYATFPTNVSTFTNDSGYIISSALTPYLLSVTAASTYQPLAANLTSWSSVTRASGFDTFTITPSSANLRSLMTDKTGTGVNVFGTSPTFTTDITTPLIIGGTAVGSGITYKGTTANGTSTVSAHTFTVGNNGATTAAQIFNSGQVSIGNYASPTNLRAFTVGQDTAYMSFGSMVGTPSSAAIYLKAANPSPSNWAIASDGNNIYMNTQSTVGYWYFSNAGNVRFYIGRSTIGTALAPDASGATTTFTFTKPNNTGQTASTAINGVLWNLGSRQWATGAISSQKEFELTSPTYSFVGASTITNAYTLFVNAPTAGTNATITNKWSIGTNGNLLSQGSLVSSSPSGGVGYFTGAGATVTQTTSRTTDVTIDNVCGSITLVNENGTATWQSFTVTNSCVAIDDVVHVTQRSGTDLYNISVTNTAAGSFVISFQTTGGTTKEEPVFNFAIIKSVTA